MSWVQNRAEEMMTRHGFLGVPVKSFERAGRNQFQSLLREGLVPESKVLDIGCGCLRTAYWLVRFLDPHGYCGIEPAHWRVDHGRNYLFTPELLAAKAPRFDFNPDFDSSVFATTFDYFLAGSIWTHASKRQIETTLDAFLRDTTPNGVFLTSYLPAKTEQDDYQGDAWVGSGHLSNEPGIVRHAWSWIRAQCAKRGLGVEETAYGAFDSQYWLRISRIADAG